MGYDIGTVDWFLGQLLVQPGPAELAELSADPWRDLGVAAELSRDGVSDFAQHSARHSRRTLDRYHAEEYWEFDKQPGTCLRMGWVGITAASSSRWSCSQ
jgi:hypothetical protein